MIDIALVMPKAYPYGLDTVAKVLVATGRDAEDDYLWVALTYLSSLLPAVALDAPARTWFGRSRRGSTRSSAVVVSARQKADGLHPSSCG